MPWSEPMHSERNATISRLLGVRTSSGGCCLGCGRTLLFGRRPGGAGVDATGAALLVLELLELLLDLLLPLLEELLELDSAELSSLSSHGAAFGLGLDLALRCGGGCSDMSKHSSYSRFLC